MALAAFAPSKENLVSYDSGSPCLSGFLGNGSPCNLTQFSDGSKKSDRFFSVFSFIFVVKARLTAVELFTDDLKTEIVYGHLFFFTMHF